jgi:TPR repeat protein
VQWFLGLCYEHGRGEPYDMGAAVALYRQAIDGGCAKVNASLGLYYDVTTHSLSLKLLPIIGREKRRGRRPPEADGACRGGARGATPRAAHGSFQTHIVSKHRSPDSCGVLWRRSPRTPRRAAKVTAVAVLSTEESSPGASPWM